MSAKSKVLMSCTWFFFLSRLCGVDFLNEDHVQSSDKTHRKNWSKFVKTAVSDLQDAGINLVCETYKEEEEERKPNWLDLDALNELDNLLKSVREFLKNDSDTDFSCDLNKLPDKKSIEIEPSLMKILLHGALNTKVKLEILKVISEIDDDNYHDVFSTKFILQLQRTPPKKRADLIFLRNLAFI